MNKVAIEVCNMRHYAACSYNQFVIDRPDVTRDALVAVLFMVQAVSEHTWFLGLAIRHAVLY